MAPHYVAEVLGCYIAGERYDRLPAPVIERAILCVEDALGCLLGAYSTPIAPMLCNMVGSRPQGGGARVLGSAMRADSGTAAFANAMLINALDFDDIYVKGHLGATTLSAALAVGEVVGADGPELIAAVVAGYEVSGRVGRALSHRRPRKEVHGHGTWQTFGAAAAAARLLGLDQRQCARALAIAGANAPVASVMKTVYGGAGPSMAKNNFGSAAQAGVTAALLAGQGFEGPLDLFEDETGFWRMFGADGYDPAVVTGGLGEHYELLNVGFKAYSCCRILQSSIESAVAACLASDLDPRGDIECLRVVASPIVCKWPFDSRLPDSMWAAQFSAPYCIAAALLRIEPGPDWFEPANYGDPEMRALMDRTEFHPLESEVGATTGHHAAAATVLTRSGQQLTAEVRVARGEAANPLAKEHLGEKFLSLARHRLSEARAAEAQGMLRDLPNLSSIGKLADLLSGEM